jgi:hypothetical protein
MHGLDARAKRFDPPCSGAVFRAPHSRLIFGLYIHPIDEPRLLRPVTDSMKPPPSARRRCRDDALADPRQTTHEILETVMFAYILEKLAGWFERSEQCRLDDYLAGSADLTEIESRLRWLEKNGYPS